MTTLYTGRTTHRRFAPSPHEFRFDLRMVLFDADRVGGPTSTLAVGDGSIIDRRDLLDGDADSTLGDAIRDLVEHRTGRRADGPVQTLCIARADGYVFNPLTIHWVRSADDGAAEIVVLEVTNTPWNERHHYVIDARPGAMSNGSAAVGIRDDDGTITSQFDKEMHVSPFSSMDEHYELRVSAPRGAITVVLRNLDTEDRPVLLARLDLRAADASVIARRPVLLTRRVWFAIHWQALRLVGKRVPVHTHPDRTSGVRSRRKR